MAAAVAEHGYQAVTISHITRKAQVSRRVFYEHFQSTDELFLAAFDVVVTHLRRLIEEAIAEVDDWPHRIVAGLRALLAFLDSEPELARLCLVDSITAGPVVARRFRDTLNSFAPLLRAGRDERDNPRPLPDSTEESLLGALASMLSRSIAFGGGTELHALLPDLVEFVLMPYLGPEEAHRLATESA